MKTLFPHVPLSIGRAFVRCYGKTFEFPAPGMPDHEKLRQKAIADAIEHGRGIQRAMTKQKQGPLSLTEEITGKFDLPPVESVPRSLRSLRKPPAEPSNPYTRLIADLLDSPAYTTTERAQIQRRIEHFRVQEEKWNRRREQEVTISTMADSEDIKRARQHAVTQYVNIRNDGRASVETVRAREQLIQLIHADGAKAGDYWTAVRELFNDTTPAETVDAK